MVGMVVGSAALRSEMMLFEIKQFPSDLDAGQVEKVPYRLYLDTGEGTVKANE
jgi:hypothetical protein